MAKRSRQSSDNGSTAVLDPPEDAAPEDTTLLPETSADSSEEIDSIPAELVDPNAPVQGPILEPEAIAVYEHEHYLQIVARNAEVRELEEVHERAAAAKKRAKDDLDEAQSELNSFIARGPTIPGRKYASRIRLKFDTDADSELGEKFLRLQAGEEFDVVSIDQERGLVTVVVQGTDNVLAPEYFEVIEWATTCPTRAEQLRIPSRVRLIQDVSNLKGDAMLSAGTELDCRLDGDSVVIELLGKKVQLKPGEYEVIGTAAPVDPNGWRAVGIEALKEHGVKPALLEKLTDAGITTLGKLLDFQQDGTELTSIDGIGGEKEAQVADAMVAFWREHPEWAQGATE